MESSHSSNARDVFALLIVLFFVGLYFYPWDIKRQDTLIHSLQSLHQQDMISFKIHPKKPYTEDYGNAREFIQETRMIEALFQAMTDRAPYTPQHDRTTTQWGMQIRTHDKTIRIGCYIPDLRPDIVVGKIFIDSGFAYFQSRKLLQWYQTYNHRWLTPAAEEKEE